MPLRRNRAIELAVRVIAAADQRLDRAIGVKRDERALADAESRALAIELVGEGAFRQRLKAPVERRRDGDILIDCADRIVERVHHEIGGVIDRARVLVTDGLRGMRQGELRHRVGNKTFLNHCRDDLARPIGGAIRIAIGGEPRGRLHQPGENGRLGQGHIARAMAEIFSRRRFDAIGTGAEINPVQIQFKNLIFRIFMLKPECEDRLLDFARNGPLLGQKEVFGELLRQCRTALHHAAACYIMNQGAQNSLGIDSQMRIEAAILDCDKGFWQIGGQVRDPDRGASGIAAIGEQNAVFVENGNVRRPFRHGKLVDRRQFRCLIGNHARARRHGPYRCDHAPIEQQRGGERRFLVTRDRPARRGTFSSIPALFPGVAFPEENRLRLPPGFGMTLADRPTPVPGVFRLQRFYANSGGLRAGKATAARRNFALAVQNRQWIYRGGLRFSESRAKVRPRPRRRQGAGVMDRTKARLDRPMKVTLERAALLKSLGHVHRVVERRNTIPILSNVLLRAEDMSLLLKATDLDLEVTERLAADVGAAGATTVPAHILYEIVRKLPDGAQVSLESHGEHGQLQLRSGRSRFNLQSLPDSDFPDLATGDSAMLSPSPPATLSG